MADRSAIEWTDATWNPVRGCSRVSAGCQRCYAERVAARFSGSGQPYEGLIHPSTQGWNGKIKLVPDALVQPLRWQRTRFIFVNSMSDLFHENVPDNFIAAVFGVMAAADHHYFQVLTKRHERALRWFQWMQDATEAKLHECLKGAIGYHHPKRPAIDQVTWPLPNVWLGVSVEDQAAANERIPLLLQTPAALRFLSCEPLLGPVDLRSLAAVPHNAPVDALNDRTLQGFQRCVDHAPGYCLPGCSGRWGKIDWVIAGGESGPGARPMHPDWARTLRDQCAAARVPFFFKQWGEWVSVSEAEGPGAHHQFPDGATVRRVGKKHAPHTLDGVEHHAFPEPHA